MHSHHPTAMDLERMSRALGLVTAYDVGIEEENFDPLGEMVDDETTPKAIIYALTQFSWVLLANLDTMGCPKSEVLEWYGTQFAQRAEELRDE